MQEKCLGHGEWNAFLWMERVKCGAYNPGQYLRQPIQLYPMDNRVLQSS